MFAKKETFFPIQSMRDRNEPVAKQSPINYWIIQSFYMSMLIVTPITKEIDEYIYFMFIILKALL